MSEPSRLAKARAEGTSGPSMQQLVDALARGEGEVESLRRQLAGAVEENERLRTELDRIRDALAGADVGQDEGLAFEVATLQAAWEEMHREAKQRRGAVEALERIHRAVSYHFSAEGGHTPSLQAVERESAPYGNPGGQ